MIAPPPKLGLGPRKHDSRDLPFATLRAALHAPAAAPPMRAWDHHETGVVGQLGPELGYTDVGNNNHIGDCTAACQAGTDLTVAQQLGTSSLLTQSMIYDCYEACNPGWTRMRPTVNDHGASLHDAVTWMVKYGPFEAFASVDMTDHDALKLACDLSMGGVTLALDLPRAASGQKVWDTSPTPGPDDVPGTWGGHAVTMIGYDHRYAYLFTWGRIKAIRWRALASWSKGEAYVLWHAHLARITTGPMPSGYVIGRAKALLGI